MERAHSSLQIVVSKLKRWFKIYLAVKRVNPMRYYGALLICKRKVINCYFALDNQIIRSDDNQTGN